MATIICVDGLGGHPNTTFENLWALEGDGHKVVVVDTTSVRTHKDRVQLVLDECHKHSDEAKIVLLGQSAGGSAVRIAAERLEKEGERLSGVILLSPAMPFGIWFMTWTLFHVMRRYLRELVTGQDTILSEADYKALISPVPAEIGDRFFASSLPIPGKEARELAFCPPGFEGSEFPTLHIFGKEDKWIAPSAQRSLAKKLCRMSAVKTVEVQGAGHLTLSSNSNEVVKIIKDWINNLT